ncbi:hypothetical protein PENSPDRAFT_747890, partial [Peniophora sp. CONT]
MSSHTHPASNNNHFNNKNRRRSTSKTWKKPSGGGHWPTHPDWPDGVTIGLRVQYTGVKAARFPQQYASAEVQSDLLRDVRADLTAIGLGTASPKTGNAHFSSSLPNAVDVFWPAYKMRPLVDYFISHFARLRPEALAGRSIYLLPPHISSLRDHPLDHGLRGYVADERTVDPNISARCRNALPASHSSPSRQHLPYRSMDSPRVKREPSTPILTKQEASVSTTEWTRPSTLPPKPQSAPTRDSILDGLPSISRKRPRESVDDHDNEPLPAKARRLAEELDIAQARERALLAEKTRISDLERSLATYKSCTALTERRERQLADILDTVFGDASRSGRVPLDALEHHYAELEAKTHTVAREAKKAREELDVRAVELGFQTGEGTGFTLPVLLDALQQIAGIASATPR